MVEASIPDMQKAMAEGRVTSEEALHVGDAEVGGHRRRRPRHLARVVEVPRDCKLRQSLREEIAA